MIASRSDNGLMRRALVERQETLHGAMGCLTNTLLVDDTIQCIIINTSFSSCEHVSVRIT